MIIELHLPYAIMWASNGVVFAAFHDTKDALDYAQTVAEGWSDDDTVHVVNTRNGVVLNRFRCAGEALSQL